ncbi:MAG TPA: hypothetical protein VIQ02_10585 [Jiangellaceae bacterium]
MARHSEPVDRTHVLVHWVEDGNAQDHRYELAWLRAEDVRRFLKT